MMFKNNPNLTSVANRNYSNSEFEGFCVDFLDELARILKFRYQIRPIATGRYDDMVDEVRNKVLQTKAFENCPLFDCSFSV